ncbi:MAG: PadR family transcriptional regulator [Actinobacteria bacterium]|nr:PadR family transcriptional regulator [Actinomycetota bacterium]
MRRRPADLLGLEQEILAIALQRRRDGAGGIHGFALARELSGGPGASRLVGHGTLYKALGRPGKAGLLESRWEDAEAAAIEGRPRRRSYSVTAAGSAAFAAARRATAGVVEPGTAGAS